MIALLAAALPAFLAPTPEVCRVTLQELVRASDAIVVARVGRLLEVEVPEDEVENPRDGRELRADADPEDLWLFRARSLQLAELDVERVLKGDADRSGLGFFAEGTWTCDVTTAIPGERALFFLSKPEWLERRSPGLRGGIELTLAGQPLFEDAWSGRGRMPERELDGETFVTLWDDVVLPDRMKLLPGPEPEYDFIRSTPLAPLCELVSTYVAAERVPVMHASARDESGSLELALRGDRWLEVRTVDEHGLQRVDEGFVSYWRYSDVCGAARGFLNGTFIGRERGRALVGRELWLRMGRTECVLSIGALDGFSVANEDEWTDAEAALRLWAGVRGLVDLPGFVDHRGSDRRWIEAHWPYRTPPRPMR